MPTFNTDSIRIFKDDSSKTVENAFNDIFYGAGASGQIEANGYPDATLSNLPFTVSDYEITAPEDLGETVDVSNGDGTVTAAAAIFETDSQDPAYPVGKFLWDATDSTALKLIGKIASVTSTTVVELENPYLGDTLNDAPCYISGSSNNNVSFNTSGEFFILVKVGDGVDSEHKIIPNNTVGGLSTSASLNTEYNVNNSLNTTYINLKRVSVKGVKENPVVEASVPAIITRINDYIAADGDDYFRGVNDIPLWVAYKINPFGTSSVNFSKNTVYSLEITETLPYYSEVSAYTKKSSAAAGFF